MNTSYAPVEPDFEPPAHLVEPSCRGPRPPGLGRVFHVLLPGLLGAVVTLEAQATVTVDLRPAAAVAAGAAWRLLGESGWRDSGVAYADLPPGPQFLEFRAVAGWETPAWDLPLQAEEPGTLVIVPPAYAEIPLHPVEVAATAGGFVAEEFWPPMVFDGLRPPGIQDSDEARNSDWERALRTGTRTRSMPRNNTGWRARLRALAFPGYEFVGWSGDAAGTRNPLSFVVQGPRRIQAHFARPFTTGTVRLTAEYCASPGRAAIHGQFGFPAGGRLEELRCRPELPPGWRLAAVDGLGSPALEGVAIVFRGLLGQNPVQFNLHVEVPAGESGRRTIAGQFEYRLTGEASSTVRPLTPLTVPAGPSPAARLALDISTGRPVLAVGGVVGKTYTLEQTPHFPGPLQGLPMWVYLGDLTLTNSPQFFADPFPLATGGSVFYRATIVE
jgi:uncharacterized repeat protein (TIGR02543 family)